MMIKLAISATVIIFLFNQLVLASDYRFSPRPNKAHLIKWRHWERQSLDDAKKDGKPILLSLSAVWCHWCHVMDETTYSDEEVIKFINENFIPVRVDADMRPDIDNFYNQGGWPSTVVLTAAGDVVHGGTYIPPGEIVPWLGRSLVLYRSDNFGKRGREKREKSPDGNISP